MTGFERLQLEYPYGTRWKSEYDDYVGTVVGWYVTREGRLGVDLQLDNARVVHVYNINRLRAALEAQGFNEQHGKLMP